MAQKKTVFYVKRNKDKNVWSVIQNQVKKPLSNHRLKSAAVRAAKRMAKRARAAQLKVMGANGRLQLQHSYGR